MFFIQDEENIEVLPSVYARDYTIQIDSGAKHFCASIDLETSQHLTIAYRVNILFALYSFVYIVTFQQDIKTLA